MVSVVVFDSAGLAEGLRSGKRRADRRARSCYTSSTFTLVSPRRARQSSSGYIEGTSECEACQTSQFARTDAFCFGFCFLSRPILL